MLLIVILLANATTISIVKSENRNIKVRIYNNGKWKSFRAPALWDACTRLTAQSLSPPSPAITSFGGVQPHVFKEMENFVTDSKVNSKILPFYASLNFILSSYLPPTDFWFPYINCSVIMFFYFLLLNRLLLDLLLLCENNSKSWCFTFHFGILTVIQPV